MPEPSIQPTEDYLEINSTLRDHRNLRNHQAQRQGTQSTGVEFITPQDDAIPTMPTRSRHSSNAYGSRIQYRRRSSGSSRGSTYYNSTASLSDWDTSSSRSSVSTAIEPSTDNQPALYPCELDGFNCDWWYILGFEREWFEHIAIEHMHGIYPNVSGCWYCDEGIFPSLGNSQEARRSAFEARMSHIAEHIRKGETNRRPDLYVIRHMVDNELVPAWVEKAAEAYHRAPQPRDIEFVPESPYARGRKHSDGPAPGYRYHQQPSYTVGRRGGESQRAYYD